MKRRLFVLLPELVPSGPFKGACALMNVLAAEREVTLVSLKGGEVPGVRLDERVRVESLETAGGFFAKVRRYRAMLEQAGGRARVASFSMGFSADFGNSLCRSQAVTCASVRGNLPHNYRFDYGLKGVPLAWYHLRRLRHVDFVVAMTSSMARQVESISGARARVIGNFIDEPEVEAHRTVAPEGSTLRIVFVGALSSRKQPRLAVRVVANLRARGVDARLDIIGEGAQRADIEREIAAQGLAAQVQLHGFLASPYELVARAHVLLLPSFSEGLSRACLEALYLGVPCVLRAVDGNSELVQAGFNGELFTDEARLDVAVLSAAEIARKQRGSRPSLLPQAFSQVPAARRYLELVEGDELEAI